VSQRKRRIFLSFGLASFVYSALILLALARFAENIFTREFGILGYPLAAGALFLMLRKRLQPRLPAIRATMREAKEKLMAWRMNRLQKLGWLAAVALLAVAPSATEVRTDFVLEPSVRAQVRSPVEGWISEVLAREGQGVEAGAVLAVLRNPDLEARVFILEQDLAMSEQALLAAQGRGDLGEAVQTGDLLADVPKFDYGRIMRSTPFLLTAMVLLAASVSLRFFRFGGVQKMVLGGISAGFLLFVLSKFTEDMSKSELMSPVVAAWIPVVVGSLIGFVVLLHQEDG